MIFYQTEREFFIHHDIMVLIHFRKTKGNAMNTNFVVATTDIKKVI